MTATEPVSAIEREAELTAALADRRKELAEVQRTISGRRLGGGSASSRQVAQALATDVAQERLLLDEIERLEGELLATTGNYYSSTGNRKSFSFPAATSGTMPDQDADDRDDDQKLDERKAARPPDSCDTHGL